MTWKQSKKYCQIEVQKVYLYSPMHAILPFLCLGKYLLNRFELGVGVLVKFIYSEKAKMFCEISTVDLIVTT